MSDDITEVIFRKWRDTGSVIALFPGEAGTNDPYTCSAYERVGQHGAADPQGVVGRTRPASPEEYAELKRELEAHPYRYNLKIIHRVQRRHLEERRAQVNR